jgi:hypothetical protein
MELNPNTIGDRPAGQQRMTTQRLDYDGLWITQVKVRASTAEVGAITPQEFVSGGIWTAHRDEPISDLLVNKITETRAVPGLYVPTTRYDPQLGPINGTRRLVENSGLITSLTATVKTTYEPHPNSKVVCYEIIETNSDGTGSSGNPAYPERVVNLYEESRGAVERVSQIVADITSVGSLVVTGTTPSAVATLIRYEPLNQFLRDKIVETFTLNGPSIRKGERYDKELGLVTSTQQLVDGTGLLAQSENATGLVKYETSPYGNPVVFKIVESWVTANFPITANSFYDDQKGTVTQTENLTTDTSSVGSFAVSSQNVTEISYKPRNEFLRSITTQTWTLGKVFVAYDVDDETQTQVSVTTTTISSADAGTISDLNVAGTQANYVPTNEFYGRKIVMTLSSYSGRTEFHLANYVFPALVTGYTVDSLTSLEGRDKFTLNLNRTASRSRVVPHEVEISYGANGSFYPPSYLVLATQDLSYQGVFFNVQASSVLTDPISVAVATGSSNPDWGVAIETYSVGATSPSASDYIAQVGNPVVISYVIKPWKYNLWRMEVISIPLQ